MATRSIDSGIILLCKIKIIEDTVFNFIFFPIINNLDQVKLRFLFTLGCCGRKLVASRRY